MRNLTTVGLFLLLSAATLGDSARAAATPTPNNPFDAEQSRLARQAARSGPEGALALLEMWRNFDLARRDTTIALLEPLARKRGLAAAQQALAGALLGRAYVAADRLREAASLVSDLGYVTDFRVVGPFDNDGKQGFAKEMGPEAELTGAARLDARWQGREREVGWRLHPGPELSGYVRLDTVLGRSDKSCAYAETSVQSSKQQPLTLWFGAGGAAKVWWNGKPVLEQAAYYQAYPDRYATRVEATAGSNRLLVKNCVDTGSFGFFLRIRDARGAPAVFTVAATDPGAPTEPKRRAKLPKAPATTLGALQDRAKSGAPRALQALARFRWYTGADEATEELARQEAVRAAEAKPTVENLILAAELSTARGEKMRWADQALARSSRDARVRLLQAQLASAGPSPEQALTWVEKVGERKLEWFEAQKVRSDVLRRLGLVETALGVVRNAAQRAPGSHRWVLREMEAALAARRSDRAVQLAEQATILRFDDIGSRRFLIRDALARQEAERTRRELGVVERVSAGDPKSNIFVARVWETLGDEERATAAYRRAIAIAPENATLHVAYGQFLMRRGQTDAAGDAFREALVYRPQDAATRERVEQIEPKQRPDEAWAVDSKTLLARRNDGGGYPLSVLEQLQVNTVFESGLGSRFTQAAWQIHNEEGARALRNYLIRFDPESQRVDIRLARVYRGDQVLEAVNISEQAQSEPWYRMYYDTRALVVGLPTLKPGDVVEVRYRVDDISHRNLYADYYGDLLLLQRAVPVRRMDYVLVTPKTRQFFFNRPNLKQLQHRRKSKGEQHVDHYFAENIPALEDEKNMPGGTESAPYLHVSTFKAWEDVGRWYWALIQDQLTADRWLRNKAVELTRGARDVRAKVVRIHNWVVRNTRYVSLSFGVHGYKPYRVTQIVQRGFGDCKDKASLIVSMLREVGVPAEIVLVRTRRNGAIHDLPASLAVFDHAIAYVPQLELYLDGTAEHSGTSELPPMDQGVTVLHVGPDSARLARTPVLAAGTNRELRSIEATLTSDGSAEVKVREEVSGASAGHYRERYQAKGTQRERLERARRGIFAGLKLHNVNFQNLDQLERPVRFEYRASLPEFATPDAGALVVQPSVLSDLVARYAPKVNRKHALELGQTRAYREERTVKLPRGARVDDLPTEGEVAGRFGKLTMRAQLKGSVLHIVTEFELSRDRIEQSDYPSFRRWLQSVDAMLRQRFRVLGVAPPKRASVGPGHPDSTVSDSSMAAVEMAS